MLRTEIGRLKGQEQPDISAELATSQSQLMEKMDAQSAKILESVNKVESIDSQLRSELESVKKQLTELSKKVTLPEAVSGILAYIDSPEDRENVTSKAEEAVSRGMTYAQADDLFKKSLPAKIYKILKAHPRLTKDFIRSIKKKFA